MVFSPSAMTPALKSIQPDFFSASCVLVEIFRVGAGAETGAAAGGEEDQVSACGGRAVAATRSLPGP